jgi:dolichyl-phosphate-mannose--protein O-mannosyl transferase
MFLYHYLPSIPFLAIIIGWVLRRYQKLIPVFFTIAFVLFIYFFPHLVGIRVPLWLDRSYYWFTSWK